MNSLMLYLKTMEVNSMVTVERIAETRWALVLDDGIERTTHVFNDEGDEIDD